MSADLQGQTDLFDLLDSPAPAPVESEWAEVKVEWLYPFTTPGEACPYCGHIFEGAWDASNDHHPMPSEGACVKMSLRRQHVRYWCKILKCELEPAKCCWGEFPKHKKATFQNVMEHLRKDVDRAREVWADMSWLEPMVEDAGIPVDEVTP